MVKNDATLWSGAEEGSSHVVPDRASSTGLEMGKPGGAVLVGPTATQSKLGRDCQHQESPIEPMMRLAA